MIAKLSSRLCSQHTIVHKEIIHSNKKLQPNLWAIPVQGHRLHLFRARQCRRESGHSVATTQAGASSSSRGCQGFWDIQGQKKLTQKVDWSSKLTQSLSASFSLIPNLSLPCPSCPSVLLFLVSRSSPGIFSDEFGSAWCVLFLDLHHRMPIEPVWEWAAVNSTCD